MSWDRCYRDNKVRYRTPARVELWVLTTDQVIILTYRSASASSRAGGRVGPRVSSSIVNKKIKVDKVSLIIIMG